MADFTIKRRDRLPALEMSLTDRTGAPVNLIGATARVIVGRRGKAPLVDAPAVVVDGAAGSIRYDWADGDTATAGSYLLEVEVTFADGRRMTCPNNGHASVSVVEDLG